MTDLTVERLRTLLLYNPETGLFVWRVTRGSMCRGRRAGTITSHGYAQIVIGRRFYAGHRLAWFYMHGSWPPDQLDHINGDRADNRLSNLRPATNAENAHNMRLSVRNASGVKGVSWHRQGRKWQAFITVNSRPTYLGLFNTREEAAAAYEKAAREHFGEFARPAYARRGNVPVWVDADEGRQGPGH